MASFSILDASKIIPEFNGDVNQLNNFLGIIEFYSDTLKDTTEANKLIKFILATRLADKVRNKLISEETPNSLESFKHTLRKVLSPKKSLASIHTDLGKQIQGNNSVGQFANRIESLIASLNELQITELGSQNRETVIKMNDQVALSTFKNGLNEPHRSTVLASRPKNLNEAIQIASEVVPQQNTVMYMNGNRRHFNDMRKTRYNNRNVSNKYNTNYNRNNYNTNNHRNTGNFQGNITSRYRVNNHNNSGKQSNFRNSKRVFITQEQGNEVAPCNPQE